MAETRSQSKESQLDKLKETIDDKNAQISERIHALLLLLRSRKAEEENLHVHACPALSQLSDCDEDQIEHRTEKLVPEAQEQVVMNENLGQEWVQKNFTKGFDVKGDVERGQKMLSMEKVCCAHQVFGKMSRHETLGIKKKRKGFKSWMFKYRRGNKKLHALTFLKNMRVVVSQHLRMVETSSDLLLLNGKGYPPQSATGLELGVDGTESLNQDRLKLCVENEGCLNCFQALVLMNGITNSSSRAEELVKEEPDFVKVNEVKMEKQIVDREMSPLIAVLETVTKGMIQLFSWLRHIKCPKCWRFKFKQRKQQRGKLRPAHKLIHRGDVMEDNHVYQEGLPLWLLLRFKFGKFKFINRKLQKMMREQGFANHLELMYDKGEHDELFIMAKTVSMRFLLGLMLGITESDAGQGQQAGFEQILLVNEWLQTSLVTQQVMRSKKIKFPKRWMFKYKYVEEDIKSLHNQLSYMSRLELEERFKSWSQRETVEAKQNLKHWYGDSLLEFLKRMEAGSSMIMVLYNNTELINYLYHLEKSCFVSIIRIENALIEARFVKTMEEYSKNHLASTLAYELFHSPRPPELCVAERMIEEDMNKDYQKQQGDWACYHVWHRWKARCCFVGVISTMWAWLFGEEGFDIGK